VKGTNRFIRSPKMNEVGALLEAVGDVRPVVRGENFKDGELFIVYGSGEPKEILRHT